jgi:ferredoxin
MIKDVVAAGEHIGRRVMTETFAGVTAPLHGDAEDSRAFDVVLARSGRRISVGADESIIQAVRREGFSDTASSCEQGWCGSCETQVLDGTPEHRDTVLTDEEREESDRMMICVSRTTDACLTLDL